MKKGASQKGSILKKMHQNMSDMSILMHIVEE